MPRARSKVPLVARLTSAPLWESRWRASSASAILAAARTIAMVCGTTMSSPPVMSSTPSNAPDVGSWIGVAAQLHFCTDRRKCSDRLTLTGWSRLRAIPGALVPAIRSSQFAPFDEADRLRTAQHRRMPANPQQLPGRVRDRHDRVTVSRGLTEHVVEHRKDLREWMCLAIVTQRVIRKCDGRTHGVRLNACSG